MLTQKILKKIVLSILIGILLTGCQNAKLIRSLSEPKTPQNWEKVGFNNQLDSLYYWKNWDENGFQAQDAKQWVEHGYTNVVKAKELKSKGLSANEAKDWMNLSVEAPNYIYGNETLKWKKAGYSIEEVKKWWKIYIDLETAEIFKKENIAFKTVEAYGGGINTRPFLVVNLIKLNILPEKAKKYNFNINNELGYGALYFEQWTDDIKQLKKIIYECPDGVHNGNYYGQSKLLKLNPNSKKYNNQCFFITLSTLMQSLDSKHGLFEEVINKYSLKPVGIYKYDSENIDEFSEQNNYVMIVKKTGFKSYKTVLGVEKTVHKGDIIISISGK